jgi:alpha-glucosidase
LPVYVRAGSVIPEQPVVQNTDETPQGPLTLNVYPGSQCHGSLYADDGNTLAYQKGDVVRVNFTCEASADHVDIDISAPVGSYQPWFHDVQLNILGVSGRVTSITADSRPMSGWKMRSGVLTLPAIKWASASHSFRVAMVER